MNNAFAKLKETIKPIGLVFGDIGTSPLYTIPVTFLFIPPTPENALGVVSTIIWTLLLLVTGGYAWLAMSLSKGGEGGTIVLKEILIKNLKSAKSRKILSFVTYIGISLVIGDAVITPAISILSAVEGLILIEQFKYIPQLALLVIAALIAITLFTFQQKGSDRVAKAFSPIMIVWFFSLLIIGGYYILQYPLILNAFNPLCAINFLISNQAQSLFILSSIFLCATGSEALYADMGQLGRKPIIRAWIFVLIALVVNYLGQGAYVAIHQTSKQALFGMVLLGPNSFMFIPFLILSIIATIIASQAMISGLFSIIYQAITTRILPMLRIEYTSPELRTQIYIGFVNWFLLFSVVGIMFVFKSSEALGSAYGFAVSGTMIITSIMATIILIYRKHWFKIIISLMFCSITTVFFVANSIKVPSGGYWSLIIAAIPFALIVLYNWGQSRLTRSIGLSSQADFLADYKRIYESSSRISGSAIFFARDIRKVPPYVSRTMFVNNIIYENNIFVSVISRFEPFGIKTVFKDNIAPGLKMFEIYTGYMEVINLDTILKSANINAKAIFYGVEDIVTENPMLKLFALIKKIIPSFVQFYQLPINQVHGVITRVDM